MEALRVTVVFCCFYRRFSAFLLLILSFCTVCSLSETEAATVYAVTGGQGGAAPSVLYTVDTATGNATLIGATGVDQITGLAFDPTNSVLYGYQNYPGGFDAIGTLHTIDLSTGTAQTVGQTQAAVTDISFDSSGQLFGWMDVSSRTGFTGFSDKLVTIDKGSGTFSLVDSTRTSDVNVNQSGLAFTPDDQLYLKSGEIFRGTKQPEDFVGQLYGLNVTSAVSDPPVETSSAPISTLAAVSNDSALTIVRGRDDDGNLASTLAILNLSTGELEIGPVITENGNSIGVTALAVPVSVPEPNAVVLLILGSARLLARRRH